MAETPKEIPQEIKEYLVKAEDAFKKHNYDYAIELYSHALELDKTILETRHYLHITKIKKNQEAPPSFMAKGMNKAKGQAIALNARKLESQGKIKEAIDEYEKSLTADASTASTLCKMAALFNEQANTEAAAMTYQEALMINPDEITALKELGRLFKDKEEFDKARQYYSHAQRLSPNDMEINQGLKDLSALQTIDKGGWQNQDTFRDKIKDKDKASELEIETRASKSAEDLDVLISSTKKQLEKEPENVSLLFKLADSYKAKNSFAEAKEVYLQVLKLKPENDVALKNIDDIAIKTMDIELNKLKEALKADPENSQIKQQIDEIATKQNQIHFERIKGQVAKLPNDLALRFKYGMLLKEKGMLNEAISQFQEAVSDPSKRLDALNMIGECFRDKGMFDLAIAQFKKALSLTNEVNQKTKMILYNLGLAYEKMGKTQEAVEEFKKIYEVDISYKDVAKKIEEAYQGPKE
jgi:tetratricopeptide (TPR) repeat protein